MSITPRIFAPLSAKLAAPEVRPADHLSIGRAERQGFMTRRRWLVLVVSILAHLVLLLLVLRMRTIMPPDVDLAPQFSVVFQAPSQMNSAQTAANSQAVTAPDVHLPPDAFGLTLPPPAMMQQASPAVPQRREAQPVPRRDSPFAHVMNFSVGAARSSDVPVYRGRGVAMGFAQPAPSARSAGGAMHNGMSIRQMSGPALGSDWYTLLHEWWAQHGHYPEAAARNGEDGLIELELRIEPSGHVTRVELIGHPGGMYLATGAEATFRDVDLPPFPPGADGGPAVLRLSISYDLIRE